MDEQHLDDDRLLDLVNELTSGEERSAALLHLRACSSCEERLRETARVHELARARAREVLATGSTKHTPRSDRPARRRGPAGFARRSARGSTPRPWAVARVAVAAAVVLLAVLVGPQLWEATRTEAPPAGLVPWIVVPEALHQQRSDAEAADPRFEEGLAAYREHDAESARRLLRAAETSGPTESARRIYLGSAELQLGRPSDALATLRPVDFARVPEPWKSEGLWALAAAHVGVGQVAEADSVWTLLAAQTGEVGDRARLALRGTTTAP